MRMCVCGGVGAGKTSFLLKFLKWYDKEKAWDKCIIFSPTFLGEPKCEDFMNSKHNFELVVHNKYEDSIMREEADMMKARIDQWREWDDKKKVWERFKKCKDVDELSMDDIIALENMGYEEPANEFPEGYPSHVLVLDDCVSMKGVFSANCKGFLTEFILRSRHSSCSIVILSQILKNFIPAQLRQGSFDKWVLFGTKSKHKESIAEEMSDKIEVDKFLEIWDYVCDEPHKCLVVDYTAPLKYMFRSGLDKIVVLEGENIKSSALINDLQ